MRWERKANEEVALRTVERKLSRRDGGVTRFLPVKGANARDEYTNASRLVFETAGEVGKRRSYMYGRPSVAALACYAWQINGKGYA